MLVENLEQELDMDCFLEQRKMKPVTVSYLYSKSIQKLDFVCKENSRLSDSFFYNQYMKKIDKKYKA